MEHTHGNLTLAVLARFIRRYWRVPAQFAGMTALVVLLLLALPFLPRPEFKVQAANVPQVPTSAATVASLYARGVGAPFTGAVTEVKVKPGQAVKKNDLLFRMDASTLQPQLAAARGEVVEARSGVSVPLAMRRQELQPFYQEVSALKRQIAQEQAAALAPRVGSSPEQVEAYYATPEGVTADGSEAEAAPVEAPTSQPAVDPARLQELRAQLATAQARLSERLRAWSPALAEAQERVAAANARVRYLRNLIAAANRRSPIDGIVTRVDVSAGQWANAGATVVRVDSPAGYRVVTRVDQQAREELKLGEVLPVSVAGEVIRGKLEKIVPGEDKELGTYWLWLKPTEPKRLLPGQQINVTLQPEASPTAVVAVK